MKIFDINGQLTNVDVRESKYPRKNVSKSNIQGRVGSAIDRLFPRTLILEEFTIPGSRMSIDFFLPAIGVVVEVQGRQHSQHVPYFHGDKLTSTKYVQQQVNDRKKISWAELNNFKFIEIQENDSDDDIESKLKKS